MKTVKRLLILTATIIMLCVISVVASAETYGDLTYEINSGEVTITDCDDSVSTVYIPDRINGYPVRYIGKDSFNGCTSMTNITIPNSIISIGSNAFNNCSSLSSITIPNGITNISAYAFRGCSSLRSFIIPDNVTVVDAYAFSGCSSLSSIIIPGKVTSINSYAFYGCSSLTNISLPASVTNIENNAFRFCNSLVSITIPNSVTDIGEYAFANCNLLTSIAIPDSVTYIGEFAFYGCSSLEYIKIPYVRFGFGYNSVFGSIFGYTKGNSSGTTYQYSGYEQGQLKDYYYYIPSSLKTVEISRTSEIYDRAFYNCSMLTNIIIPDTVKTIGSKAFYNCTSLTSITIPDSVTSIGSDAFYNCISLKNASIGDSVTSIGSCAFYNCTSLTSMTLGDSVKEISNFAFYNCKSITSISIPDSVSSIGNDAFKNCTSLEYIKLPFVGATASATGKESVFGYIFGCSDSYNSDVTCQYYSSSSSAYYYIPATLRTVQISRIKTIPAYAFNNCSMLTSITISDTVTSIGTSAFDRCSGITSITLPESLEVIGSYAFRNCTSLNSIVIPDNVTYLSNYGFSGCTDLEAIVISDSINTISGYVFNDCTSVSSVYIPKNVKTISDSAFKNCSAISDIYYDGTQKEWNNIAIGASNAAIETATVHYGHKHSLEEWTTIAPGIEFSRCRICKYEIRKTVPVDHIHNYTRQLLKQVSCVSGGEILYSCDCTLSYIEIIPATGHSNSLLTAPEYSKTGYTSYMCSVCTAVTYEPITYFVEYNANGGTGGIMDTSTHTFGVAKALTTNIYTRTGYTFLGWARSKSATTPDYIDGKSVRGLTGVDGRVVNLYAVWKPVSYYIKYNANGGYGTMANSIHTFGVEQTLSENTFRRGQCKFIGWATSSYGNPVYSDSQPVSNLSSTQDEVIELYAKWEFVPTELTVNSTHSVQIPDGIQCYSFTPTKSDSYIIYSTDSYGAEVTLYNAFGLEVKSDSFSGSNGNFMLRYDFSAGKPYTIRIRYAKASKTGTIHFTLAQIYYVSYDTKGGKGTLLSQDKVYGKNLILRSTIPTKTGYTFLGWSTRKNATTPTYAPGSTYTANADVTLYAVWKPNTYYVKYNANGGTGTMANSSHTFGTAKALSANKFTRTGYTFLGWARSKSATTPDYVNGKKVSALTGVNGRVVNLYAVWKPITYKVAYNANGGTGTMANSKHTFGTAKALSANKFTRTGYTFLGWARSKSATTPDYINGKKVSGLTGVQDKTVILYAVWKPITYKVAYNANGGTGSMSNSSHTFGTAKALSANKFTRTGYTFLGWSANVSATTPTYTNKQAVKNLTKYNDKTVTLYAVWKKK